jgi:hypothetical protein
VGLLLKLALLSGVVVALLVPAADLAATPTPAFSFGRAGGNILPYTVTIAPSGAVTAQGVMVTRMHVTTTTLASLRAAQATADFARLPAITLCNGSLPDLASLWIRAHTTTGVRRVAVRGTCSPAFTRLYRALSAAVGLAH